MTRGEEIFSMTTELDPKFLKNFSTDYAYEELTDEQKEVHDALFAVEEEIEVDVEAPAQAAGEANELDDIINLARGEEAIRLPESDPKPVKQTRFEDIAEKEPESGEEEWEEDGEAEEIELDEADLDEADLDFIGHRPDRAGSRPSSRRESTRVHRGRLPATLSPGQPPERGSRCARPLGRRGL